MELLSFFSPRRKRVLIEEAPERAQWRNVRPRKDQPPVRARRAEADTVVGHANGDAYARGGADYIVAHGPGDYAVVRGDIFERTYESLGSGLYRKRTDIVLRCFTLDRPALIRTLEGLKKAERGDWVMQGTKGELWPVEAEKAQEKYEPA